MILWDTEAEAKNEEAACQVRRNEKVWELDRASDLGLTGILCVLAKTWTGAKTSAFLYCCWRMEKKEKYCWWKREKKGKRWEFRE